MDDLTRISVDEQTETQRREARKFVQAIAGDVSAYFAALPETLPATLREALTADFGPKWHAYQLDDVDSEVHVSVLYGGG